TGVTYHLHENPRSSSFNSAKPGESLKHNEEHGSFQKFSLTAQPTSLPYTPERKTPKPRTTGPQTAVVVGPAGEEIWTDEYGRIKVQFHWDRLGAMDENSSCWMRVATSWAGSGFGAISIPRIGHEVVVDFLNGDPDYPLVVGCVYNAANMPPWALPGNATQSGIKTKSSKGGAFGDGMKSGAGDANAIRFEDKKGAEQLWLHAQKDQLTEVENDEDKWVGNDRRKTIDRDETNTIHRDRTETVDRNEKITVHGWRTEEVDGDETITIHSNRKERVDHNETISIGDNRDETVGANEDIRIGSHRSKTVGQSEKDRIGTSWNIRVGTMKTETIGMTAMQNVGLAKMVNVGLAYSVNIGGVRNDIVGANWTRTVIGSDSVSVGSDRKASVSGTDSLEVSGALTVKAKTITLEAGDEITLRCGSSTVRLTPALIEVLSSLDKLNC
ncbi:type VI secretion system Vgr family protein, partial [Paracidovorax cattleyae]|uniref:type VI secretion system Vgr family protein n=1 Tax=Paracidovorax cattleyae TaxID=80868 RepID=UPI0018AF746B